MLKSTSVKDNTKLSYHPQLIHAYSTVEDGNMSFTWGEQTAVLSNRAAFLHHHGLSLDTTVTCRCDHTGQVAIVTRHDAGRGMAHADTAFRADALITQTPGLGLFLLTADCLPLTLYNPSQKTLAVVHLSRRTLDAKLLSTVVAQLAELEVWPADFYGEIGPYIHPHSYVFNQIPPLTNPDWSEFMKPLRPDTSLLPITIDLAGFALKQLHDLGFKDGLISVSASDTATNKRYFSHVRSAQRSETEGRFATLSCIKHM